MEKDIANLSNDITELKNYINTMVTDVEQHDYDSDIEAFNEKNTIVANFTYSIEENADNNFDLIIEIVPRIVTDETEVSVKIWGKTIKAEKTDINTFTVMFDTKTNSHMDITGYETEVVIKNGTTVETEVCVLV